MRWIHSTATAYAEMTVSERPRRCSAARLSRHIAGPVEVVATSEQQGEDDHRRERSVVDAVQDMQRGRQGSDPDCHLPGPMPPPHETSRGDEQCHGCDDTEGMGKRPDRVGSEVVHQSHVLAGQHRMQKIEQRANADDEPDDDSCARAPTADGKHSGAESDDHGGQIDRREAGGDVERVSRRDLSHDGDGDAGLQIREGADPDREEERGGKTLDRRPTRIEPERYGSRCQTSANQSSDADAWCESSSSGNASRIRGPGSVGFTR